MAVTSGPPNGISLQPDMGKFSGNRQEPLGITPDLFDQLPGKIHFRSSPEHHHSVPQKPRPPDTTTLRHGMMAFKSASVADQVR